MSSAVSNPSGNMSVSPPKAMPTNNFNNEIDPRTGSSHQSYIHSPQETGGGSNESYNATNQNSTATYYSSLVSKLKPIRAIRDCSILLNNPGHINHFDFHLENLPFVADKIVSLIQRDYNGDVDAVPPYSRCKHFKASGTDILSELYVKWYHEVECGNCDEFEPLRRMVELNIISILIDANAGDQWTYVDPKTGKSFSRSDGIALATADFYCSGKMSDSPKKNPCRVDANALEVLDQTVFRKAFQVDDKNNDLVGSGWRLDLLRRLGKLLSGTLVYQSLDAEKPLPIPECFKPQEFTSFGNGEVDSENESPNARLGYIVDYLLLQGKTIHNQLSVDTIWEIVVGALSPIWPYAATKIKKTILVDVWPCVGLRNLHSDYKHVLQKNRFIKTPTNEYAVFQTVPLLITYALVDSIEKYSDTDIADTDGLVTPAEFRNCGVFVDYGVLTLRQDAKEKAHAINQTTGCPIYYADSDVVIEWRCLSIALADEVARIIRARLLRPDLSLSKILEAGLWKAGKEIAHEKRPVTKGPPIEVITNGILF